jgi:hypothetical protein
MELSICVASLMMHSIHLDFLDKDTGEMKVVTVTQVYAALGHG